MEEHHQVALEGEGALLKNHLVEVGVEELQAQNELGVEAEGVGLQTLLGVVEVEVYRAPQILPQEVAEAAE
jgi:hypothetical protein